MVQAAAAGVVDFGRADPRDPKWWRYLRLIVDRLEQENLKEYHRLYHERLVSVLSREGLTQESVDNLYEASDSRIGDIAKVLFPWADLDRGSMRKRQAQQMRETWEAWFGKLDDPDTQRRIKETAEWLTNTARRSRAPGRGRR
jgi:hypothetical protein